VHRETRLIWLRVACSCGILSKYNKPSNFKKGKERVRKFLD
jgi:hypothetical protein